MTSWDLPVLAETFVPVFPLAVPPSARRDIANKTLDMINSGYLTKGVRTSMMIDSAALQGNLAESSRQTNATLHALFEHIRSKSIRAKRTSTQDMSQISELTLFSSFSGDPYIWGYVGPNSLEPRFTPLPPNPASPNQPNPFTLHLLGGNGPGIPAEFEFVVHPMASAPAFPENSSYTINRASSTVGVAMSARVSNSDRSAMGEGRILGMLADD